MARKFKELRKRMPAASRRRSEERASALLVAMTLSELREACAVTQEQMAELLDVAQSNVSRVENRADMRVSTLRQVVQALGGELEIIARFSQGAVRIRQFDDAA